MNVGNVSEGVVIGSQIVTTLANAPPGEGAQKVEEYCSEITGRKVGRHTVTNGVKHAMEKEEEEKEAMQPNGDAAHPDEVVREGEGVNGPGLADQLEALNMNEGDTAVPSRFGEVCLFRALSTLCGLVPRVITPKTYPVTQCLPETGNADFECY